MPITTEWKGKDEDFPEIGDRLARIGDAGPWQHEEDVLATIQSGVVKENRRGVLQIEPDKTEAVDESDELLQPDGSPKSPD